MQRSLLVISTAARPAALLELTTFQCDFKRNLIDLNPPGRLQTKKRRPVVPMPEILKEWLQTLKTGHVIQYRGKSLKKINAAWRNMRKDAGLDENVIPYSVRHTVATELRARGVPELEIAGLLGHNMPNFRSTGRYAKYNPEYLGLAVKAINEVLKEIGRATTRPV